MTNRHRWTASQRRHIYLADMGICRYCHRPVAPWRFDVAHEVAFSEGGSDKYSNTALAHEKCNRSAGAERLDITTGHITDRLSTATLIILTLVIALAAAFMVEAIL